MALAPKRHFSAAGSVSTVLLGSAAFCSGNPVVIDPTSLIAFGIVAFAAFVVEAGIVAIVLLFSGLAPTRILFAFFAINAAIFWSAFFPLSQAEKIPLLGLETIVVLVDAAVLMVLSRFEFFQGCEFERLRFSRALLASVAGNAASFFVGVLAAGSPWEHHA